MPAEPDGWVCVLVIDLHFPLAASLKGRRRELAPVTTYLRGRVGASVAETGGQDTWQRATLTATLAGRSAGVLERAADGIEGWLEARFPDGVRVERRVLSVRDLSELG